MPAHFLTDKDPYRAELVMDFKGTRELCQRHKSAVIPLWGWICGAKYFFSPAPVERGINDAYLTQYDKNIDTSWTDGHAKLMGES